MPIEHYVVTFFFIVSVALVSIFALALLKYTCMCVNVVLVFSFQDGSTEMCTTCMVCISMQHQLRDCDDDQPISFDLSCCRALSLLDPRFVTLFIRNTRICKICVNVCLYARICAEFLILYVCRSTVPCGPGTTLLIGRT